MRHPSILISAHNFTTLAQTGEVTIYRPNHIMNNPHYTTINATLTIQCLEPHNAETNVAIAKITQLKRHELPPRQPLTFPAQPNDTITALHLRRI